MRWPYPGGEGVRVRGSEALWSTLRLAAIRVRDLRKGRRSEVLTEDGSIQASP
jgi:hypothetical protein